MTIDCWMGGHRRRCCLGPMTHHYLSCAISCTYCKKGRQGTGGRSDEPWIDPITMVAVPSLFGRCGLGPSSNASLINGVVEGAPARADTQPAPPVVRASSRFSCITPSKKYQPLDGIISALEDVVPELLDCISAPLPSPQERQEYKRVKMNRGESLQKIHDLTKKGKEFNRIPLVASTKWDIIGVLSQALLELPDNVDTPDGGKPEINQDRRLLCWTINNLSIPYENKSVMSTGDSSSLLFHALTDVIEMNLPSSYLCIICFMNLTFWAGAIEPVTYYIPPTSQGNPRGESFEKSRSTQSYQVRSEKGQCLLENPSSLIRSLERMMTANLPYLLNSVTSVEGEAIRWACGLIRNITYASQNADGTNAQNDSFSGSTGRQGDVDNSCIEEICTVISQTEIPQLIVTCVRDSPNPAAKWTKDSLEDICLGVICQLVQWPCSREALKRAGATLSLERVEG